MSASPRDQRLAALALGADLGLDALEDGVLVQHVVDDARFHAARRRDWNRCIGAAGLQRRRQLARGVEMSGCGLPLGTASADIDAADIGGGARHHRAFGFHPVHEGDRRHHDVGDGRAGLHVIDQRAHALGGDRHLDAGLLGVGRREILDAGIEDHAGVKTLISVGLGMRRGRTSSGEGPRPKRICA